MSEPMPPELYADPPLTDEQLDLVIEAVAEGDIGPGDLVLVDEPTEDVTSKPPWRIGGDREAEWAIRVYGTAAAEIVAAREQAAEWKADIDRWLVARTRRPAATVTFMGFHLRAYQAERRAADPKAATLTLPSGKVSSQLKSEHVEIADPAALTAWARGNDRWDVLKVEPQISLLTPTVEVRDVKEVHGYGFSCGHTCLVHPGISDWTLGEELWCNDCHADVTVVEIDQTTSRVVFDKKSGKEVPGTAVVPPHVEVGEPKPAAGR